MFVEPFAAAVDQQKEGMEVDDATECLNYLLGYSAMVDCENFNTDTGATSWHKEMVPLGLIIDDAFRSGLRMTSSPEVVKQFGIKLEKDGFIVVSRSEEAPARYFLRSSCKCIIAGSP